MNAKKLIAVLAISSCVGSAFAADLPKTDFANSFEPAAVTASQPVTIGAKSQNASAEPDLGNSLEPAQTLAQRRPAFEKGATREEISQIVVPDPVVSYPG